MGIQAGDLTGDGAPELVTADYLSDTVSVYPNSGTGTFSGPRTVHTVALDPDSVTLADFDGDNRLDIGVAHSGTSTVSVIRNDGAKTTYTTSAASYEAVSFDADGDGRADLVSATASSNDVFLNTSTRPVTPSTGAIAATGSISAPNTFTQELWFKTTTSAGGKLTGFGSDAAGLSASYDRHLYMTDGGKLIWGVYPNSVQTVTSARAYNDGRWHQAVASLGAAGMKLHVDGALVASNAGVTTGQAYAGHWRLGGDALTSWPSPPTSLYFAGTLDESAIYPAQLSDATIAAHYAARTGTGYRTTVLADSPSLYWRLADTSTNGVVVDETANGLTGRTTAPITLNWPGALGGSGAAAGAAQYDGTASTYLNGAAIAAPDVYTQELWLRTTALQGGKLIGFGNVQASPSNGYDRHVYMLNDGRLAAGVNCGGCGLATAISSATYNDGAWHHVASTLGATGLRLYVDDELVASNAAATSGESLSGWWRVGGDNLTSWPSAPTDHYFHGAIDEVSVYHRVLTPAQIRGHFRARNRTG